jgi:hypothetical protein
MRNEREHALALATAAPDMANLRKLRLLGISGMDDRRLVASGHFAPASKARIAKSPELQGLGQAP